jgi:hypothetical protein
MIIIRLATGEMDCECIQPERSGEASSYCKNPHGTSIRM